MNICMFLFVCDAFAAVMAVAEIMVVAEALVVAVVPQPRPKP